MTSSSHVKGPQPFRRHRLPGFTLIELIAVIAIIALLVSLLYGSLGKMMQRANMAKATSNLHAIASGITMYRADNDDKFPFSGYNGSGAPTNLWMVTVLPYLPAGKQTVNITGNDKVLSKIYVSPLLGPTQHANSADFGVNGAVLLRYDESKNSANQSGTLPLAGASVIHPSQTALVMTASGNDSGPETGSWYVGAMSYVNNINYSLRPSDHGTGNVIAAFVDGHTEAIPLQTFQTNRRNYLLPNP